MLHLFDIVGGDVVIHADLLALPPFEKVWTNDKTANKERANKVIRFIILCDYWNSPYYKTISDDHLREEKLKAQIFSNKDSKLSLEEQECRDEYKKLLETRNVKMLKAMMNKLDSISNYYEQSLAEELDEKKIQLLLAGMEKVKGVMQTLDFLEKSVKAEELDTSKVRGDAKINPYELVNKLQ
jgi:hypothetical protein